MLLSSGIGSSNIFSARTAANGGRIRKANTASNARCAIAAQQDTGWIFQCSFARHRVVTGVRVRFVRRETIRHNVRSMLCGQSRVHLGRTHGSTPQRQGLDVMEGMQDVRACADLQNNKHQVLDKEQMQFHDIQYILK